MLIHASVALVAPYVKMDMNPLLHGAGESVYKDAMFFSVHKFVGGVQTPGKFGTAFKIKLKLKYSLLGVLVAKKSLFKEGSPNGCGGGSVFFVTKDDHRYVQVI